MKIGIVIYIIVFIVIALFYTYGRGIWYPILLKIKGKQTLSSVIEKYEETTWQNFSLFFEKAGIAYPPKQLALIAFKDEKILHVWAANGDDVYKPIRSYPILASSGVLGPKLREGDRQVPEGLYKIIGFNPNSSYHLSMKLNYPNAFDLKYAKKEGRNTPGTNIFIHGRAASVGCLAMGDLAIEELFTLIHAVGRENTEVLISPSDPKKGKLVVPKGSPEWTGELYEDIENEYKKIITSL